MIRQLFIGLCAEGRTDYRFLNDIIYRTFDDIICRECDNVEIWGDVLAFEVEKTSFIDTALAAAHKASGISVLCIHTDADSFTSEAAMSYKITPFLKQLEMTDDDYCKVVVPIIPVTMTEAWMLADKELFKLEIDAKQLTDKELDLEKKPELYRDPKAIINRAIDIANQHKRRRTRTLTIESLYGHIGGLISLDELRKLTSFQLFEKGVRDALRRLNYLH
jgi:hypothetical protein